MVALPNHGAMTVLLLGLMAWMLVALPLGILVGSVLGRRDALG